MTDNEKCTKMNCPMQAGYPTELCKSADCPYRTEPVTHADHIRAMTDEEMAGFFASKIGRSPDFTAATYHKILGMLQQPYESPTGQKG